LRTRVKECYQSDDIRMQVEKLLKLYPYCHIDSSEEFLTWKNDNWAVLLRNIDSIEFFENKAVLHCEKGTMYDEYTLVEFHEQYISFSNSFSASTIRIKS
jgi:hypothetical protein